MLSEKNIEKQKDFTDLPVIINMKQLFFHREGDRS